MWVCMTCLRGMASCVWTTCELERDSTGVRRVPEHMVSRGRPPEVATPPKRGANGRDDGGAGGARRYGGGALCEEEVARSRQDCEGGMQTPSMKKKQGRWCLGGTAAGPSPHRGSYLLVTIV